MVDIKREGFNLLVKLIRGAVKSEESTEVPIEEQSSTTPANTDVEPMPAYWEKDLTELRRKNQPIIDQFLKDYSLNRIPDATEEPITESQYKYDKINVALIQEAVHNLNNLDAPETPKTSTGISSSGRDAGVVAGIVVAVISGVIILAALIAAVMYRHYVHRNVTSMNFDNPVYRKTTEDQFAIEKNGYAPGSKLYPSTVGEEAKEPLNTPGTNDFV